MLKLFYYLSEVMLQIKSFGAGLPGFEDLPPCLLILSKIGHLFLTYHYFIHHLLDTHRQPIQITCRIPIISRCILISKMLRMKHEI